MKFSNMSKMLIITTLIIGGLSACGYNKGTRTNLYDGVRPYTTEGTYIKPYPPTVGIRYNGTTNNNLYRVVADRAVNEAILVNGVTKASAVFDGKDIVIGIKRKSGTDPKTLEKQVYQTVKSNESGYNIYVTSDPKIVSRIRKINSNMTTPNTLISSHPVRDLARDVGDLIRDIGQTLTAPLR